MKKLLIICLAAGALACGQTPKQASSGDDVQMASVSTTVDVRLDPQTLSATLTGSVDSLMDSRTFIVEATAGQQLLLELVADTIPANIRVNQIISPSAKADGPFGMTAEYDITETGKWIIVVGESLMVGEEYKGGFTLSVSLK